MCLSSFLCLLSVYHIIRKFYISFYHIIKILHQYLLTILPPHGVTYVQPAVLAGRGAARLQDQLVEGAARFYEFSVLRQNLLVRDEDVGSLAQGMLTARYAMHGEVELRTAIPARDGDDAAMQTKRFQHLLAQHHQSDDDHGALWSVVDAILDGGARAEKLSEGEVSGEEHLLHPLQF